MATDFSDNIPIYLQIMNEIKLKIVSGFWTPGYRLQSVRDLAVEFSVNPNTMQRALSELEREGLLYTERTTGRFVSEDKAKIAEARDQMAAEYTQNYFDLMGRLGYTKEGITERILDDLKRIKGESKHE